MDVKLAEIERIVNQGSVEPHFMQFSGKSYS